ncbi:MAG: hypothetical protein ABWK04_00625 [Hydrogenobacter sp.]
MRLKKGVIGVEFTQSGIYVCSRDGNIKLENLQELKEFSSGKDLGIAVGRDVLLVRKYTFPIEALDDIKEAVMLNIEEIFPLKVPLKVTVLPINTSGKEVECFIFAIPQSLYDEILSFPNLKFLVPSPILYKSLGEGSFYRKLSEGLYEKVVIRDGKLTDSILSEEVKEKELRILDGEYSVACLTLDVLLKHEPLELAFYDKRKLFRVKLGRRYLYPVSTVVVIVLLSLSLMAYDYYHLKRRLDRVNEEIARLQPLADRYSIKLKEVDTKRTLIKLLKERSFIKTFADFVQLLPPKTKILSLQYDAQSITAEGYTLSLPTLTQSLQGKYRNVQVQASNFQPPYGQPFKVRIGF